MPILSIELSNEHGVIYISIEKNFSETRFISSIMNLYKYYKPRFFICNIEVISLIVFNEDLEFRIDRFNKKQSFTVINEARHIYREYKQLDSEEVLSDQLVRACQESEKSYNADKCAVCLEPYGEKIYILACLHKFHVDCIEKTIKKKNICPLCRIKIDTREYT